MVDKYGSCYGCDAETKVRRLMMWSLDQIRHSDLTISGPGYADVEPSDRTDGANAGILKYYGNNGKNIWKYNGGYGAWVVAGETYTISGIE